MTILPWIPSAAGSGGNAHIELYYYDALVSYGSSGSVVLISEAGTVSIRDGHEVCGDFSFHFPFLSGGYSAGRCGCSEITKQNKRDRKKKRERVDQCFSSMAKISPLVFGFLYLS